MIVGDVSAFVDAAYAVALGFLAALAVAVIARGVHWAQRAKELERKP